jgi:succinate dehydrogenase flavin-adding protein (antitoxin of CptAB toxin-antitoxin module)
MRKQIGSSLPFVLLEMIQSNQFYPTTSWVMSSKAHSIWKCMVMHSKVSMDDICKIFFECTTRGSQLKNFKSSKFVKHVHSSMETQLLEEYVPLLTCERDQVF